MSTIPDNERHAQADVYSFGLILWEMLSLRRPFEGLNRKEFVQTVIKGGRRPPLQQEWSGALRELMRRCWDEDMDTRPGKSERAREGEVFCRVLHRCCCCWCVLVLLCCRCRSMVLSSLSFVGVR